MNRRNEEKVLEPRTKTYRKPELTYLGSLTEITKGPAGGNFDAIIGAPGGFDDFNPVPEVS